MGSIDDLAPVGKYLPSSLNHLEQIAPGLELVFQTVGLSAPRQELHRRLLLFRHSVQWFGIEATLSQSIVK